MTNKPRIRDLLLAEGEALAILWGMVASDPKVLIADLQLVSYGIRVELAEHLRQAGIDPATTIPLELLGRRKNGKEE